MNSENICHADDGWGATAAYKSLKNTFTKMDVLTSDENLKNTVYQTITLLKAFSKHMQNL